jgi:tetratricopeptide (TPR) repeat protein
MAFPREKYNKARIMLHDKKYTAAIDAYENILAEYPNIGVVHNDLGVLYAQLGDNKKALAHYEAAVKNSPDNGIFVKNLADFYYVVQKNTEKALQMYVKYLSTNPNDVEVLMAIGHISIEIGQIEGAKDFYNKILEIDPQNENALKIINLLKNQNQNILTKHESTTLNAAVVPSSGYLVSAIVSVYNSERFIRGCIEDLEAQTIADRLEIIVIDSCSPQKECEIIEEMQHKYNNIKYIRTDKRKRSMRHGTEALNPHQGSISPMQILMIVTAKMLLRNWFIVLRTTQIKFWPTQIP